MYFTSFVFRTAAAPVLCCSLLAGCLHPSALDPTTPVIQATPTNLTPPAQSQNPNPTRIGGNVTPNVCENPNPDTARLTLDEVILGTLCSNPKIRASLQNVRAEDADHRARLGLFAPTVTASTQIARNDTVSVSTFGRSVGAQSGTSASLSVGWVLLDFGGRSAQVRAGHHAVLAAIASEDLTTQATLATASEAFFNVIAAEKLHGVALAAIANARMAVDVARVRRDGGAGTEIDVSFAQANLMRATATAARAAEQAAQAKGQLAALMNLSPNARIAIARHEDASLERAGFFSQKISSDIERLMKSVENHPQIREAAHRAAITNEQIQIARSDFMPKVNLVANAYADGRPGASLAEKGSRERFLGLTFSLPIADGLIAQHKVRGAEASHARAIAQLEEVRRDVQRSVWAAYQTAKYAEQAMIAAMGSARHANAAMTQAENRYRSGAGDLNEWLRAQRALQEAQQEVINNQTSIRAARLRLFLALGQLGPWTQTAANARRPVLAGDARAPQTALAEQRIQSTLHQTTR